MSIVTTLTYWNGLTSVELIPPYRVVYVIVSFISFDMYQLQIFRDGEWTNTSYMPTVWEVAKRRLNIYVTQFPHETYSILRIK